MIHAGRNEVDGVPVEVTRKRCRRINLRVGSDGVVRLTVPKWWATLREGEDFLLAKWSWVLKVRGRVSAQPARGPLSVTETERAGLCSLLMSLHEKWSVALGEFNVKVDVRAVRTFWGSCRWGSRCITYNLELAHAPRELVEYVVVHEFTHFAAHDHGPKFYALMDERLPGWKDLRKRLNRRDWGRPVPPPPPPPPRVQTYVQDALPGFGD